MARDYSSTTKHGKFGSRVYGIWAHMLQRCLNPKDPSFKDYGLRGISVCSEWKCFEAFYADMGDPPNGLTLDRVDNSKGYCLANCKWDTKKHQARNRRDNRQITFNKKTQTMAAWAEELGINYQTLSTRLYRGWSVERALST